MQYIKIKIISGLLIFLLGAGCSSRKLTKEEVVGRWICSSASSREAAPPKWRDKYWLEFKEDGSFRGCVPRWMVDSSIEITDEFQPREAFVPQEISNDEWWIDGDEVCTTGSTTGSLIRDFYWKYKKGNIVLYQMPDSVDYPWIKIFFVRVEGKNAIKTENGKMERN